MLRRRTKFFHGFLSLAAGSFNPPPFCSNPKSKTLKTLTTRINPKNSKTAQPSHPRSSNNRLSVIAPAPPHFRCDSALVSPNSANPDAESICYLLSEPSNQTRDVDDLLREHRSRLSSDLVLEILTNYRKLGRTRTLEFFSWAGFQLGFHLDDAVVEYMADFLGRRKLFDDLKCLLRTISSRKGRVSSRTVSICIRFLGRQGRVGEALSLFDTMELEFNCPPDNLVFNNVLYVLCKMSQSGDSIDIALAIFRRIGHPDEYSYSNILVGLCKTGRVDSALEMFYEMDRASLVPTRGAANVLIGELCELGSKSESLEKVTVRDFRRPFDILIPNVGAKTGMKPAVEVFWAVCKFGLLPSAFIVNRLVSQLCRSGEIEEAVDILKVVGDRKPRCVEESYETVIKVLCRLRMMDDACDMFGRMVSQGLKPKAVVYSSIICALCKLGNVVGAEKYFGIMNKMRCEPDGATYTVLIHAYCRIRNWEAAYDLLMEMIGLDLCPHFDTFSLVDDFLEGNGRTDLSVKLEAKMEAQILLRHCRTGQLEAACEKLTTMLAKGFFPPIYTRDAFERAFRRSSRWKIARELLDKMDRVSFQSRSQT